MSEPIRVVHVDDEPEVASLTATYLEREDDRFTVETAHSADEAGELITDDTDCVVSDYDMPGQSGIEFLEAVREGYPDLPFILFTGQGSEAVASDAISAGVTDYLQKGVGPDQYTVLANRITNAVDRYHAERERRQWKRAVETANEGIAILDEDGRYVQMNDAYAEAFGESPEELIGTRSRELYPDDEAEWFEDVVRPQLREEGTWEGEAFGRRADGTRFEQKLSLAALDDGGHVCVMEDITERKERERSLQETTARLEALFEQSPDMINVHDTDGNILDPNPRLCERTGYDEGELAGMKVWDLDVTVDPDEVLAFWDGMDAGDRHRAEGVYRRADGSTFPVEVHVRRLDLETGDRFVAISRDVTERAERERRLKRQNDRLEGLTRVVSHDLRNPLRVAEARVELAREGCDDEHLDAIADALARMDALIENMLAWAREGDGATDPEPLDLPRVADSCWANVETGRATLDVAATVRLRADESRLGQLLENLFRNAVEHGGPKVTVTVGDLDGGFFVEDDGPGIPEAERERVFEPGYSTGESGTGFGLSIVEQIADAHGWEVAVTESGSGGARFEITGVEAAGA